MKFTFSFFLLILLTVTQVYAQNSLAGNWEGGITIPSGQLKIVFNIDESNNSYSGTLDIPQQGAKGLRFESITQNGDSVSLIFRAGQVTGTFTGVFDSSTKITGSYSQGGPPTPFTVEQTSSFITKIEKPENETDLIISNEDIEIGGTLTLPTGQIESPLLIMISGSGAQDRDSNIYDFKIFSVIAQALAKKGIPSFRYDDRGINKSTGDFGNTTLDDLASDVEAIMDYFIANKELNFQTFTVLGHSQGGVVAGKVAAENKEVVQLILMGSTAPSLSDILRYQVEFAYSASPIEKAFVDKEINAREELMEAIALNDNIEIAKLGYSQAYTELLNALPEVQRNSIPDISAMVATQTEQLVRTYSSPQIRSLLFYEPTEDLEKVSVPTLVLFGEKDTQVTITQNQAKIRNALQKSGSDFEIKVFESANHLFQKANTGLANEYSTLDKNFVDGFLNHISNWILNN